TWKGKSGKESLLSLNPGKGTGKGT
ncbi:MAG: hypothetical protein FD149_2623, partial [Rhodospirillaceae bacterium]